MKRLLLSCLALFLFVAPSTAGVHRLIESVRPLQMVAPNGVAVNGCTATSINQDKQYWLTAAHCVDAAPVQVMGDLATVKFMDRETDLAVVQTKKASVKALKLRQDQPGYGEKVYVVGHPLGFNTPVFWQGYIAAPHSDWGLMILDMESCGGNSGSSIVDGKDRVVSVLQVNERGVGEQCAGFTGGSLWPTLVKQTKKFFG